MSTHLPIMLVETENASKVFQSISPQNNYKVVMKSFLSLHLQSTLKALGGIGGVVQSFNINL